MLCHRGPVRAKSAPSPAPSPARRAAAGSGSKKPASRISKAAPDAPKLTARLEPVPETPRSPPQGKPMIQQANFAAQAAVKPEPPVDASASSTRPKAYSEAANHPENAEDIRKKFKAGKPNPLIAHDALVGVINAEKVADRIAPKQIKEVKAAFVDSSTRTRLKRANALNSGELVNIDPDYFDAILDDFPIVAQHSKVHGTGLFAKTVLPAGAELFTETPFASVADTEIAAGFCAHCLRVLGKIKPFTPEELKIEYGVSDVPDLKIDTPDLPDEMVSQLLKKSELSQPGRCECAACKEVYCSEKCRDEANTDYHSLLCNNPHLKLIDGADKGTVNMTNLLVQWWARLEIILTKERVNPFDNDFGRMNYEKAAASEPITTQEEVLLMNCRTMFPSLATTKLLTAKGLQTCKSILNHNSYDCSAYRIGLRIVKKADAVNDIKQLQGIFELPQDALPPTITIGKGKSAKNDWVVMPAISNNNPIRGYSLHVLGSYFNHSCQPNVLPMPSFTNEITFVTLESLNKGDELTINYIGSMTNADRATRQRVIKERFHFDCNCARCRAEAKIEM